MTLELRGTAKEIEAAVLERWPRAAGVVAEAKARVVGRKMLDWQALLLAGLVAEQRVGKVLEIGTYHGYATAIIALAAAKATIVSLNPREGELKAAKRNLAGLKRISLVPVASWDYLAQTTDSYNLIFVDGDHNNIGRDLPWFGRLKEGGLMLFHDFSPVACPPVFQWVTEFAHGRHGPDVLAMDSDGIGMAGLVRRAGETA